LPSFALPKSQVRCVGRPQAGFKARRASESVLCHQKKSRNITLIALKMLFFPCVFPYFNIVFSF
jgi:hypothetical protein